MYTRYTHKVNTPKNLICRLCGNDEVIDIVDGEDNYVVDDGTITRTSSCCCLLMELSLAVTPVVLTRNLFLFLERTTALKTGV